MCSSDLIKAIIFDLGYSLNQISDLNRGISFNSKGKLDMRMGLNDFSCDDVISKMTQQSLFKIFKYFGDEKYAKPISKKIVQLRKNKKIKRASQRSLSISYTNSKVVKFCFIRIKRLINNCYCSGG